jgi:tetratricopeptide (TPR) repeat protein
MPSYGQPGTGGLEGVDSTVSRHEFMSESRAERLPLSFEAFSSRLGWRASPSPVQDTAARVSPNSKVVEDFVPAYECLDARLSSLYWRQTGVLPFADNSVPFVINNSGRLSEVMAGVFFAHCQETCPEGPIRVLELGAGTGLFARYFLEAFQSLCREENAPYFERLSYLASDASPTTVAHWAQREVFGPHGGRVHPLVVDAVAPEIPAGPPVRAVFCNYVLDVLPAAVVRRAGGTVEQLCVRTHLSEEAKAGLQVAPDFATICARAASRSDAQLEMLLPLIGLLEPEVAFRPVAHALPFMDEALADVPSDGRTLLNFGALQSLEACLALLARDGIVLVNDYGATTPAEAANHGALQRFGSTTALGLNFPLIEKHFAQRDVLVTKPSGDDTRPIHTRLLARLELPRTREALDATLGPKGDPEIDACLRAAREHMAAGRKTAALDSYREALKRAPRDWAVIGEAAEFVAGQIGDHEACVEMCQTALRLNPLYSTWLWNVLGDSLYCLQRYGEAHECYLQAARINANDPRTCLNLAYTHLGRLELGEALAEIARGLESDRSGAFVERLLSKQREVLAALAERARAQQGREHLWHQRFSCTV